MRIKFFCYAAIIITATCAAVAAGFSGGLPRPAAPAAAALTPAPRLTVVLVPLDSRPPCTQYLEQLGRIAGIRVVMPPAALLDNYKQPGDKTALRAWLAETAPAADAAIVSADMLIHGGLLASRLGAGTAGDVDAALKLFEEIHQANPALKIYVFNIIPRLLIADSNDNLHYQGQMLKYSLLKDKVLIFENPADFQRLAELDKEIPPEVSGRYLALYEANTVTNLRLMALAENGTLAGLVVGQDDGQPFGLPNIVKKRLADSLLHNPRLAEKTFITRGTDEVALTLLGRIATASFSGRPRIYVHYSNQEAPGIVMPFMPHSVSRTAREKIDMVNGVEAASPDQADFTLFIHIGTQKTTAGNLRHAAREIKKLQAGGYPVAVVDLSEDFYAHETLLPYLLEEGADVTRLAAYAGWNTTSNSIGTAITQAAIFTQAGRLAATDAEALAVYGGQLEFLASRLLDDWYYQKEVQPYVNSLLRERKIDAYNLGPKYDEVNSFVQKLMAERADRLYRQVFRNRPLVAGQEKARYFISGFAFESALPWDRTFEIKVKPALFWSETAD